MNEALSDAGLKNEAGANMVKLRQDTGLLVQAFEAGTISAEQFHQGLVKLKEKLDPEFAESVRKVNEEVKSMFTRMESSIASSIVHWKGLESSMISIFQSIAQRCIEILENILFKKLEALIASALVNLVVRLVGGG